MQYAVIFMLLTGVAMSQIPDAPSAFRDPIFIALSSAHLITTGLDAYATSVVMSLPGSVELNPLDRPFVSHGDAVLAATWSVESSLSILASAELQRHRHKTMGRALQVAEIAGHSYGAWYSFSHRRTKSNPTPLTTIP
jgi:hypothetical protein